MVVLVEVVVIQIAVLIVTDNTNNFFCSRIVYLSYTYLGIEPDISGVDN